MTTEATQVRLLSYNIRSMRDDVGALARVIRAAAPDVVCLQEAPRFFRWRRHAARLGRATGLAYITGGAPACGNMIMATLRPRVEHVADVELPYHRGHHRRALATAVLRFGDTRLAVIGCHLSLHAGERRQQSGLVLERVAALDVPATVVAGDLNERPGGRAYRTLTGRLGDAWTLAPAGGEHTFPAHAPDRRIDAVLTTAAVTVMRCGVPTDLPGITPHDLHTATDHLPVLAELSL
jgi:endonuclease/exonuclease/phosphatase family metal-dependent hydrolase